MILKIDKNQRMDFVFKCSRLLISGNWYTLFVCVELYTDKLSVCMTNMHQRPHQEYEDKFEEHWKIKEK